MTAVHIGVLPEATLEQLSPLHEAALGCITFAAGSELVIEQLRAVVHMEDPSAMEKHPCHGLGRAGE